MVKIIDARGKPCPEPVLMAKAQVEAGEREITVLVDNKVAVANVTRFLNNAGYEICDGLVGEANYRVEARYSDRIKELPMMEKCHASDTASAGDYALMILSQYIGSEENGLGEVLMKSLLGTIGSRAYLPKAVALMNNGVKLTLAESSCSEILKELEDMGVDILVCGTCTKHFDITDRIVVGRISNMFEITEAVFSVAKPIVIG